MKTISSNSNGELTRQKASRGTQCILGLDSMERNEILCLFFFYHRNLQPAVWRAFNDSSEKWSKSLTSLALLKVTTNLNKLQIWCLTPRFSGTTFNFQSWIICHLCFICSGPICSCTAEGKLRLERKYWRNVVLLHKAEISAVQPTSLGPHHMLLFSFSCCSLNGVSNIWWYTYIYIYILLNHCFTHGCLLIGAMKQQLVECCDLNITSRAASLTDIKLLIKRRWAWCKHSFDAHLILHDHWFYVIVAYKNDEHGWITYGDVQIRRPSHSRVACSVHHMQRADSCRMKYRLEHTDTSEQRSFRRT